MKAHSSLHNMSNVKRDPFHVQTQQNFSLTQKFEYKNEFSFRLRKIIAESEKQTEAVAEKYMLQLRVMYLVRMQIPKANSIWIYNFAIPKDENRYHEDIFGITLRTTEIHNKSRETAKIKMESQSSGNA